MNKNNNKDNSHLIPNHIVDLNPYTINQNQLQKLAHQHNSLFNSNSYLDNPMLPENYNTNNSINKPAINSDKYIFIANRRVSMACDYCRKRKIKCSPIDLVMDKCNNCIKYNVNCKFPNRNNISSKNKTTSTNTDIKNYTNIVTNNNNNNNNDNDSNNIQTKYFNNSKNTTKSNSGIIKKVQKFFPPPDYRNSSINSKLKILDGKISDMIDNMTRIEWLLSKVIQSQSIANHRNIINLDCGPDAYKCIDKRLLAKYKQYNTSILTAKGLQWVKDKTTPDLSTEEFVLPLTKILSESLKWYIIQSKNLIDFSSQNMLSSNTKVFPLPSKEQSKRLLENFYSTIISSSTGLITLEQCFDLIERYYDNMKAPLSYPESLLLNVCLCVGANATEALLINEIDFIRKDRHNPSSSELIIIENNMLLNAMHYYHRLSMVCSGLPTIQALLLLTRYLADNFTIEIADDVLTTAIRFAVDLRLGFQSYYEDISNEEYVERGKLWWHCFCIDKKYSLILSRPPLLKITEMDFLTDEKYYEFIKNEILPKFSDMDAEKIGQINDLQKALDVIVTKCDYMSFFISYYFYKVVKIEMNLFETCFSSNMTTHCTFNDTINKIMEIQKSLIDWKENLHVCIKLNTYRQYLCSIFTQLKTENPAFAFELACSRIINCHFRHLYLVIILNLFAVSFLEDNKERFARELESLPITISLCSDNYRNACIEMLQIFLTTNYHPHRFNESMYHLFTGFYLLILDIIKSIDESNISDVSNNIFLLETCHKHILGENYEYLTIRNVKWQVSIFFFTFLMKYVNIKYNSINCSYKDKLRTDDSYYDDILSRILKKISQLKKNYCERLYENVQNDIKPDNRRQNATWTKLQSSNETGRTNHTQIDEYNVSIFGELTPKMLKVLDADMLFNSRQFMDRANFNKESLFPLNDDSCSTEFSESFDNSSINPSLISRAGANNCEIIQYLPFGDLYFDREFYFMEIFKIYNSR